MGGVFSRELHVVHRRPSPPVAVPFGTTAAAVANATSDPFPLLP